VENFGKRQIISVHKNAFSISPVVTSRWRERNGQWNQKTRFETFFLALTQTFTQLITILPTAAHTDTQRL
jgi:hypothetical protein